MPDILAVFKIIFLHILLRIFTLFFVNQIAGIAFLALGIVLYSLLYRFTAKLNREIGKEEA